MTIMSMLTSTDYKKDRKTNSLCFNVYVHVGSLKCVRKNLFFSHLSPTPHWSFSNNHRCCLGIFHYMGTEYKVVNLAGYLFSTC